MTVSSEHMTAERLERLLRKAAVPVIVRVAHDKIVLSVRTVREEEMAAVAEAFAFATAQDNGSKGE